VTRLRPLHGAADDAAVRRLFRATLGLGRPLAFPLPGIHRYEALCLDWYLGPGRDDAAVLELDGTVVGYVLVCCDASDHARAQRVAAARFTAWAAPRVAARRLPEPARTFWRLRLLDGATAWRTGVRSPAHAHVNLDRSARGTGHSLEVRAHIDARVRRAGHDHWIGEINAVRGRRAGALARLVGEVVDAVPSRTYAWLEGRPVDRLTVRRRVPAPAQRTVHLASVSAPSPGRPPGRGCPGWADSSGDQGTTTSPPRLR
jgi:hypothetical protein